MSKKPKQIMLTTFVEEEKRRLDGFAVWWMKMRSQLPDQEGGVENWPLRMPPGEWDEQYLNFDHAETQ